MQLYVLLGSKNEALMTHTSKGKHKTLYIKKKYSSQDGECVLKPPLK
jgi:hypothetical protein